jgi:hypothetical protein
VATVKLRATRAHQLYKTAEGKVVPGGSTVAGVGEDQGFLINWAWKQGCAGEDYKKVTDKASDIGTVAHFLITCHFNGDTPDFSEFAPDTVEKGHFVFSKFVKEWQERELEFVANEVELVSNAHGYGGTLDLIARDKSKDLLLLDIKSSPRIYPKFFRQVAGYAELWNENNLEKISKCYIFRHGKVDPDDTEVRRVYKQDLHFEVFLAQLNLYNKFKKL